MLVGLCALPLFAAGVVVLELQRDRHISEGTAWMLWASYVSGIAFVLGSLLALGAAVFVRARPVALIAAVVLTVAVAVPSHFIVAFPLVAVVWAYAYRSQTLVD